MTKEQNQAMDEVEYYDLFKSEHDAISEHFIECIGSYVDAFMASEAGEAYIKHLDRLRAGHRSLVNNVIHEKDLRSFQGKQGIDCGPDFVIEFFQHLAACSETADLVRSIDSLT